MNPLTTNNSTLFNVARIATIIAAILNKLTNCNLSLRLASLYEMNYRLSKSIKILF